MPRFLLLLVTSIVAVSDSHGTHANKRSVRNNNNDVSRRASNNVPVIQPRIISGENAPKGRYPWIVRYVWNKQSEGCGGSMIVSRSIAGTVPWSNVF